MWVRLRVNLGANRTAAVEIMSVARFSVVRESGRGNTGE